MGLGALLALLACQSDREFSNPYLPGDPDYAGDDWTRDSDGDGVADSIEKYLPDCKLAAKRCLDNAKILSGIPLDRYALAAGNMLLWIGDSARQPKLEWNPPEAALRGYALSVSDSSVVRVRDGKLVGMAIGSAQVDVSVPGMRSLGASFVATVAAQGKRVDSVRVPDLSLHAGDDTIPPVSWFPADAAYRGFSLSSDQPAVAAVSGQSLRALAAGKARVTLETMDGARKAVFSVAVSEPVRARALSAEPMYLVQDAPPQAPHLTWTPTDASDQRYRLVAVESTSVASISADSQKVVPKQAGATQMLALSADGKLSAEFTVNVSTQAVPVAGLTAQDLDLALGGGRQPPRLFWNPADATDRRYALFTGDSSVAVPSAGTILPVGMGVADFQVTSVDGGFSASFKVNVGLPDTTVHVDSVQVEPFSVAVGTLHTVFPVWFPSNPGNQAFTLSTSDTGMVGIRDGSVAGRRPGTADMRLVSADGGHIAAFKVTVFAPVIPVQQVMVDPLTVYVGGDGILSITWTPADATNLGYTLTSQDPNVAAIVSKDGAPRVRGMAVGTATVVLRSADGPTASFPVTVAAAPIKVASIGVANFTLGLGDSARAPAIVFNPSNATDKGYTLNAPSAGGVFSVSGGKVAPLKTGKAPLTVIPADNPSAAVTCTVTVVSRVRSVAAKDDTLRLGAGDKAVAGNLTWDPPDASDKSFSLKSNDTAIVNIAANGTSYHGVAGGTASVIVRALDGFGKADTFTVLVQVPVTQVSAKDYSLKTTDPVFNPSSLFTWTPSNASNKNWSLSYTSPTASPAPSTLVSIVNGWQLQGLAPGTARITVNSADNPSAKDTFTVTVIRPVSGLSATSANVNMRLGDPDAAAPVAVSPADASDKGFTLTSGNPAAATVAAGNKIHAVAGGVSTFTATSTYDASKTATFTVTVAVPVQSVSAPDMSLRIGEGDKDPSLAWTPSNATNKGYILASSNTGVLTIVSNKLHGVAPGTANATVTSSDGGKQSTFAVTVVQPVSAVSVANFSVYQGDPDRDPAITWSPANASNKGYTLSGGNGPVATVVNNKVHAVGAGSANFTLTAADNGKTASFTVTVKIAVTGIQAMPFSMKVGDPDQSPDVTVSPPNATVKSWHLVSADPGIASIVNGTDVHAVSRGDVNITVISDDDPTVTDVIKVSVKPSLLPP